VNIEFVHKLQVTKVNDVNDGNVDNESNIFSESAAAGKIKFNNDNVCNDVNG
jgi:hypothetical protein